jgi:flagellar biosynthesis/type III secretory pathway protein FliH
VPALEIVVPVRVQRVEKSTAATGDQPDAHEAGFRAGYEEGQLRAQWEAERRRKKEDEELRRQAARLKNLYREFGDMLAEHLPDLIEGALQRVFRQHPFTTEEISGEIKALLRDMEQASCVTLECAPDEAGQLQNRLEEGDAVPAGANWKLISNPLLESGEFLLKSDLGDVDGRHLSRVRQIRMALEATS